CGGGGGGGARGGGGGRGGGGDPRPNPGPLPQGGRPPPALAPGAGPPRQAPPQPPHRSDNRATTARRGVPQGSSGRATPHFALSRSPGDPSGQVLKHFADHASGAP